MRCQDISHMEKNLRFGFKLHLHFFNGYLRLDQIIRVELSQGVLSNGSPPSRVSQPSAEPMFPCLLKRWFSWQDLHPEHHTPNFCMVLFWSWTIAMTGSGPTLHWEGRPRHMGRKISMSTMNSQNCQSAGNWPIIQPWFLAETIQRDLY